MKIELRQEHSGGPPHFVVTKKVHIDLPISNKQKTPTLGPHGTSGRQGGHWQKSRSRSLQTQHGPGGGRARQTALDRKKRASAVEIFHA